MREIEIELMKRRQAEPIALREIRILVVILIIAGRRIEAVLSGRHRVSLSGRVGPGRAEFPSFTEAIG